MIEEPVRTCQRVFDRDSMIESVEENKWTGIGEVHFKA
jgi:hypothetical protein